MIAIAARPAVIQNRRMTDERRPPRESAFPAGDDANDARWLADLIQALRGRLDGVTYSEVSAILAEAQRAAQAAAERVRAGKAH